MPIERSISDYSTFVLRVGLAAVILWFGSQQLLHGDMWVSWVPAWTEMLGLVPERIVLLNGLFELAAGIFLLLGLYTRIVAAVLFLHMLLLVWEIGITPVGVRDFGLATGFFALALESKSLWALTK